MWKRNDSTWKKQLKVIKREMARFDETVNSGITKQEANMFAAKVVEELDISLPQEYLEILRTINGIEFNGFILYGVDEELLDTEANQMINGLIDNNKVWNENEWENQYLFLGESSISWYAYDLERKQYVELDNPSGDMVGEFNSCEELVGKLLGDAVL